jgi:hypothetical protein
MSRNQEIPDDGIAPVICFSNRDLWKWILDIAAISSRASSAPEVAEVGVPWPRLFIG